MGAQRTRWVEWVRRWPGGRNSDVETMWKHVAERAVLELRFKALIVRPQSGVIWRDRLASFAVPPLSLGKRIGKVEVHV